MKHLLKTVMVPMILGTVFSSLITAGPSPSAHAPIGVMGDHTHKAKELMLSYRYMSMPMNGLRQGTKQKNNTDTFSKGYMMSPEKMDMQMHMVGAMYAPNNTITIMGMLPIISNEMSMINRMGVSSDMSSNGIGDTKLSLLIQTINTPSKKLHIHAGITLPTGDLTHEDTMMGSDNRLPYPMQLGSGTIDLLPGITYREFHGSLSWGIQGSAVLRSGYNNEGYQKPHQYQATTWISKSLNKMLSGSLRLQHSAWDKLKGRDDDMLAATLSPPLNTTNSGGQRTDLSVGINTVFHSDTLGKNRVAIEYGVPIFQDLGGIQLELDSWLILGLQKVF
ncbi:alpha amylase [Candidatus Marinamargulisbacteria bacterium SCGC AG-439-L15]|nr:alpha amylase [Candidatus Marinamargulisbacteria bacterium SCGC AG-439-L15]